MEAMDIDTNVTVQTSSQSTIEILLHPLALMNISDHITRAIASSQHSTTTTTSSSSSSSSSSHTSHSRAIGMLLGAQKGRSIEISNTFEVIFSVDANGNVQINQDFLSRKTISMKNVFKDIDVVGWYSTGKSISSGDHAVHKTMCELFDTALYMLVDSKMNIKDTELPIQIYEGNIEMVNGKSSLIFSPTSYKIETQEAERIAVDHISHYTKSTNSSSQLVSQLNNLHNSISMLSKRTRVLGAFLEAMESGQIPKDRALIRQLAHLSHQLPTLSSNDFNNEFNTEINDNIIIAYLAAITSGCAVSSEISEKIGFAYTGKSRKFARAVS